MTGDRRATPPVDLNVINYQVGALQTSLDRGLATLERTIERGLAGVAVRLDRIEEKQTEMEKAQDRQNTRLTALEEFRRESERIDEARKAAQDLELRAAMDGSSQWKTARLLAVVFAGALTAIGTIIAIIVALSGGMG